MGNFYTLPSFDEMTYLQNQIPEEWYPNGQPYAVVCEGFFDSEQCRQMITAFDHVAPHRFPKCDATTREGDDRTAKALYNLEYFARSMNDEYWDYGLSVLTPSSWLQTYEEGEGYNRHADTSPAQSRKLTAVVQLSDETDYLGGELILNPEPHVFQIPKSLGTVVVFQPWITHQVQSLYSGTRRTINMGFYGPPFK